MIRVIVKTFAIQIRQFLGAFDVFCLQWPDLEFQTMKFLILIKLCLEFQVYPGVLSSVHIRVFHTRQATYLLWKFARVFAEARQHFFVEYFQYMSANASLDCLWHVVFLLGTSLWSSGISSHSQLWWIHIIFKVARAQQVLQRWIGSYKVTRNYNETSCAFGAEIWDAGSERWTYHFLRIHVEFSQIASVNSLIARGHI